MSLTLEMVWNICLGSHTGYGLELAEWISHRCWVRTDQRIALSRCFRTTDEALTSIMG